MLSGPSNSSDETCSARAMDERRPKVMSCCTMEDMPAHVRLRGLVVGVYFGSDGLQSIDPRGLGGRPTYTSVCMLGAWIGYGTSNVHHVHGPRPVHAAFPEDLIEALDVERSKALHVDVCRVD